MGRHNAVGTALTGIECSEKAELAVGDAAFEMLENGFEGGFFVALEGGPHLGFLFEGITPSRIDHLAAFDCLGEVALNGGNGEVPVFGDFLDRCAFDEVFKGDERGGDGFFTRGFSERSGSF